MTVLNASIVAVKLMVIGTFARPDSVSNLAEITTRGLDFRVPRHTRPSRARLKLTVCRTRSGGERPLLALRSQHNKIRLSRQQHAHAV